MIPHNPPLWPLYLTFLHRREEAREAKELGVIPHSDDPILCTYSFCNINREHDRVTRWVKANVRDNRRIQNATAMVINVAIARIFNDPDTFAGLKFPVKLEEVQEHVMQRQAEGKRIFRGAYMMPSHGTTEQLKMSPALYYLNATRELIPRIGTAETKSLEAVCNAILSVHGFGPFLANQIVTDLRYTKWWRNAPDWNTFVLGGPGTSRGLCRLFGEPPRIDRPQKWIHPRLMAVRERIATADNRQIAEYFLDPNNISNSFCEFDKYVRVLRSEGRVSRKYNPR